MSRPFAHYSAKPAFAQVKEPMDASEYTKIKKTVYSFCNPNICHPNKNIYSESNKLALNTANNILFYPNNLFDKTQLYINLYTELKLNNKVYPIINLNGNSPVVGYDQTKPYNYIIDPSGNLFGQNLCEINNYVNYMVYDTSCNLIEINNYYNYPIIKPNNNSNSRDSNQFIADSEEIILPTL